MNGTGGTWFTIGYFAAIVFTMLWFFVEATGGW